MMGTGIVDLTGVEDDGWDRVLGGTEPYPDLRKDLPWDRPPAPSASEPEPRLSAAIDIASEPESRELTPAEVKADARRRAIQWAKVAEAAWEKALDWIDINDPALPGDYATVSKALADFVTRLKHREESLLQ